MAFFFKCLEATAALMWLYINKMELNFLAKVSLVSSNLCFGFCNLISSVRNEQLCMLCRSHTWMNIQIIFIFLKMLCIVLSWCSIMGWTWPHPFSLSFADLFKFTEDSNCDKTTQITQVSSWQTSPSVCHSLGAGQMPEITKTVREQLEAERIASVDIF